MCPDSQNFDPLRVHSPLTAVSADNFVDRFAHSPRDRPIMSPLEVMIIILIIIIIK